MIGTTEILIISGVVLLLFGASAIPRFARSLGRVRREFEHGIREGEREATEPDKGGKHAKAGK